MPHAWWVPVVLADGAIPTLLLRERTLPGTIMLNRSGRRFTNEAANYNALGAAFHEFDVSAFRYANDPAWLVISEGCVQQYGVFGHRPGEVPAWLSRLDSTTQLAGHIAADPDVVAATVDGWNAAAGDVIGSPVAAARMTTGGPACRDDRRPASAGAPPATPRAAAR